ncbi:hypothetical protein O181_020694 [Austropuccinia psidii MF-1]|uniref:Uncharacterized protein n=1 Tax=Austropuccinia psidii MF-1 TaxID=1389203 RepID=A0A9Q3CBR7_9BASI|nr:hypothetical protein [Austropuccinia psidii MF-1]
MGVHGNSSLTPIYGQLDIPSFYVQLAPFWCLMAFGPYPVSLGTSGLRPYPISLGTCGIRPYPVVIGLLCQFSTSPTPRPICLLWEWGSCGLPGAFGPSSHLQGLCPPPLIRGSMA